MTTKAQLLQAVDDLNEHLLEAGSWLEVFNLPDTPAPGVFAASRLFERVRASAEALEMLISRQEDAA